VHDQNKNLPENDDGNELVPTEYANAADFSELTLEQKRYRTKNITETLHNLAANNNLSINQLIGYLLYRVNYHSNRMLAAIGQTM
jgi:hypothetical protein